MRLTVPPVMGVNAKTSRGVIQQFAHPAEVIQGEWTKFAIPSRSGWKLAVQDGRVVYVFAKAPPSLSQLPGDGPTLLGDVPEGVAEADLSDGKWLAHPDLDSNLTPAQARENWFAAFNFVGEEQLREGQVGLRRPQLGALHAIHAHWSTKTDVATVVMPTGTGKTETMLATMISARCTRIMVIVPTDALRTQIALKFRTLGILKDARSVLLKAGVMRPVVGTLEKRPTSVEEVEELFRRCNVIVSTSILAAKCSDEVQARMAEVCTHLFIDEAHHAEAPTWHALKSVFKAQKRQVLQFTATPFREDGVPLDGEIIYVYPMRQAQREGYFRPIRFSSVYAFNSARADRDIATKVIEELKADATGLHVAMARVSTQIRAAEVLAIYEELGEFNPVMLHSGMKKADAQAARGALDNRKARIVVCVDMLGEGFDMPELKIAAFHDLRKSLAVTLQLAGRFTRSRDDLGDPVFIANIADVTRYSGFRRSGERYKRGVVPRLVRRRRHATRHLSRSLNGKQAIWSGHAASGARDAPAKCRGPSARPWSYRRRLKDLSTGPRSSQDSQPKPFASLRSARSEGWLSPRSSRLMYERSIPVSRARVS